MKTARRALGSTGRNGFTLLELLVVIAILGLLAAYAGPKFFAQIGKSRAQIAQAQIDLLQKALEQYRIDTGHYPAEAMGLAVLNVQPQNEPDWHGPYLKKRIPPDPWGFGYRYRMPGTEGREYEVVSFGGDGTEGGEGENADVRSWD
ncbi:type II secretion system major pseudopilin GspG [Pseudoduganella violacea]|uniref:Type II secretion system core protein G n=1 Tax=Pseudoduganella violacea TaxID=1715466 RepID=A0A7W5FW72_9BURK|nr:type II secretion system major pseudopilin GspG [Pseudoduganella violacea]MBB3121519.1 general secretion pathway protein G [Pseudoduganella violacea]